MRSEKDNLEVNMNYREFNERVYNYKHGIKTVADDQSNSIEHGIIGEGGDYIAHYELGQEADPSKRKYIDKIYLGEGKYRYVYDDGTSSTGYKPLDVNDPVRQNQRAKIEGQQNTKQQAEGIGKFLSSNVGRTGEDIAWQQIQGTLKGENERKENSQVTPTTKETWERIEGQNATKDQAQGISNFLKSNIQESYSSTSPAREYGKITTDDGNTVLASKDYINAMRNQGGEVIEEAKDKSPNNPDFANARKDSYDAENRDKAIPTSRPIKWKNVDERSEFGKGKAEEMAALYGGTGGETKPNTGALGTKVAPDSMKSTSAPNYASGLASNLAPTALPDAAKTGNTEQTATGISDFLKENVQNPTNPATPVPQGAPYSELQSQSVNATRDSQARKIVDDYMWQLEEDVYDPLKRAGYSDDYIWGIIDAMESSLAGEAISRQLSNVSNDANVIFFPGAEEGLQVYLDNVLPILKKVAANATPAQNSGNK